MGTERSASVTCFVVSRNEARGNLIGLGRQPISAYLIGLGWQLSLSLSLSNSTYVCVYASAYKHISLVTSDMSMLQLIEALSLSLSVYRLPRQDGG